MGILAYSPLSSGMLTGKYGAASTFDHDWRGTLSDVFREGEYEKHLTVVEALKPIARDAGLSLAELAIAWVLARDGVTTAIIGANKMEQLTQNLNAADIVLDEEILRRVDEVTMKN